MQEGVSAEVLVLREVLEGLLAPEVASEVMFAALELYGRVPSGPDEVLELIDGPLHTVLGTNAGPAERDAVVDRARSILGRGRGDNAEDHGEEMQSGEQPVPALEPTDDETPSTRAMPTSLSPVAVAVAARTDLFAQKLLLSLGPSRVRPTRVGDAEALRDTVRSEEPLLVLVDAHDPPDVTAERLGGALGMLPDHIVAVIWGADTLYGMRLARSMDERAVLIHRGEGLEPLVDLVGSRHQPRAQAGDDGDA